MSEATSTKPELTGRRGTLKVDPGTAPVPETIIKIVEFGNTDRKLLKQFVRFAWDHYKDVPLYIPPLNMDLLGSKMMGHKGLLTADHPFHKHAEVVYYLAYRGREIVGRIAGCIDRHHNRDNDAEDVIFGFFECIDDKAVARILIDKVAAWGRARGMKRLLGPMSFNTNHVIGCQMDAFDTPPYFETAHNHPYYGELMDSAGLLKVMDVIAQRLPLSDDQRYEDGFEKAKKRAEETYKSTPLTIRSFDMSRLDEEMEVLREVYNEAWSQNWGSTQFTDEEFNLVAKSFKAVADPETILIAYMGDEPVAIFATMPDFNDCIKREQNMWDRFDLVRVMRLFKNRKKTQRGRVALLGIKEKYRRNGVKDVLIGEGMQRVLRKKQFNTLEFSWLLETNELIVKTGEAYNAKRYKTWRIYERSLIG
ncbi:MAG: hypothetical protein GY851_04275 [bacterium]|nr:hypothetical protein [bacterium]